MTTVKRKRQRKAIPWPEVFHEARQRFGIKRFRPGQREVLESIFKGHSILAIMSTGAGKSLTYQIPAFLWGDVVRYRRFVAGNVLDIHQSDVLAQFEKAGKKRLRTSFLRKAS